MLPDIGFTQTKWKYAQHISECKHEYGTVENTVYIIRTAQKGRYLDAFMRFSIYKASTSNFVLNGQHDIDSNVPFILIINRDKTKCINKWGGKAEALHNIKVSTIHDTY